MNECNRTKTKKEDKKFISVSRASILTGICPQTLRLLSDQAKIPSFRTPSGQRKFNLESIQKMCHLDDPVQEISQSEKKNFIYARVSSKKQMDDLSRQVEYLRSFNNGQYSSFRIVQDIASGLNFKRKGFDSILDSCLQKNIGSVVVAHRDRLCRFGFELVESIILKSGGTIIVTDDEKHKTSEQELSEDLLSIIHIFSCKQMGRRKYKTNEKCDNKIVPNNGTEIST